jgi:FlaG/FlaF family flagellin (archaellin)
MRFRFQIVSSNYHKGRIRIFYDPNGGSTNPEYNTHYTTIHDISMEKDFTVDIGWAQPEPYRKPLGRTASSFTTSRTVPLDRITDRTNGVLSVHVLNELTVPGTVVADIQVNVFVSMLDDFEVAMPATEIGSWRFRNPSNPQMGIPEMGYPEMADETNGGDMDCCDDAVMDPPTIDTMADAIIDSPDTTKLFFGEVIGSFRQMLKRTCLAEISRVDDFTSTTLLSIRRRAFPEYGGLLSNAATTFQGSVALTYQNGQKVVPVSTTYINYVARMFLGWRGSIRWTFDTSTLNVTSGSDQFNSISTVISRTHTTPRTTITKELKDANGPAQNVNVTMLEEEDGMFLTGAFVGNTNVNPIHSVEVPFYTNRRFFIVEDQPSFSDIIEEPSWRLNAVLPGSASDTDISFVRMFCSAGEDFNLFFFNGMPPMFYEPSLPFDPGT